MVTGLMFKFLTHIKLIFMTGIRVQCHLFYMNTIFPTILLERLSCPQLSILDSFVKYAWIYFWALHSTPLIPVSCFHVVTILF